MLVAGVNECFDRYEVTVSLTQQGSLIIPCPHWSALSHSLPLIGQPCPSAPPSGDNDSIAARLLQGQECK